MKIKALVMSEYQSWVRPYFVCVRVWSRWAYGIGWYSLTNRALSITCASLVISETLFRMPMCFRNTPAKSHSWLEPNHRGDQTWNIWIPRFGRFSRPLFSVMGTPFTHVKPCLKFCGLPSNIFDMYWDSRENLFEIVAVVIIWSPISSICGHGIGSHWRLDMHQSSVREWVSPYSVCLSTSNT